MKRAGSPLSLRARLELSIAILFLGGILTLYFAARANGRDAADRSFDRLLAGAAMSITESVSIAGGKIGVDVPYAALDMLSAAPDDRVFYSVTGSDGRTVTGYTDLPVVARSYKKQPSDAGRSADEVSFFDAAYRGESVRFARLGRQVSIDGALGWIWVQVGQTRLARESIARDTVLNALIPISVVMVLAMAVVWFGVAHALSPLQRIGAEVASRSSDDLRPIESPMPRELRPFVQATNGLMSRLAANIDALKSFIADASHQMRTPLAALLAQAQAASESQPQELERSLEAITRNGARLAHLLNQLLSDATVAHRAGMGHFDEVDLIELLRESIKDTAGAIEGSDVRLRTSLPRAILRGDPVMLAEAFKNIIHNALRHGRPQPDRSADPDSMPVEVAVRVDGREFLVEVSDDGPGIPVADRERVFERFVRLDPAAHGAGIGLAITKRAVEVHRGRIELCDGESGGLIVRIRLPL